MPFDVEPKKIVIPPHEHRYVTCYFTPQAMQTYFATLEADVELGTVPTTKRLAFDLMAEGTLPHVVVAKPSARNDEGAPQLTFPRLLVGRSARQQLTLINEGVLPATVSVSQLTVAGPFSCVLCGQSISLPPMGEQSVDVVFKPLVEGNVESTINISVHHNDFEVYPLALKAEGHVQEVAFEDMPPPPEESRVDVSDEADATPDEDKLSFGDVEVGVPKTLSFTLRNFSATPRRFEWTGASCVTFSPSVGHLPPNGTKAITVTFSNSEPIDYEAEQTSLALTKIAYPRRQACARVGRLHDGCQVSHGGGVPRARGAPRGGGRGCGRGEGGRGGVDPERPPPAEPADAERAEPEEEPPSPPMAGGPSGRARLSRSSPSPCMRRSRSLEEGEEAEAPLHARHERQVLVRERRVRGDGARPSGRR